MDVKPLAHRIYKYLFFIEKKSHNGWVSSQGGLNNIISPNYNKESNWSPQSEYSIAIMVTIKKDTNICVTKIYVQPALSQIYVNWRAVVILIASKNLKDFAQFIKLNNSSTRILVKLKGK